MESVHPNIDNRLPLFKLVHFNNAWKMEYVVISTSHIQMDGIIHTNIYRRPDTLK